MNEIRNVTMNFDYLKNFMDSLTAWRIPGNSISVYCDNKEVFRYSSGYNDVENGIKMNGSELLNIYSCSKVATVTAALQLYEQGKFLLNDPLYEYIPEFKEMNVIDKSNGSIRKADNPITVKNLFTMTGGFDYNINCKAIENAKAETDGRMNTLHVIKNLAKENLLFEPGTHWNYSLCHDILAGLVEVVSGRKFADYVKENVFAPIGITDIYYHRTEEVKSRTASQYWYKTNDGETDFVKAQMKTQNSEGHWENVGKDVVYEFGPEYDSGGAGITISVPDYARFASALANFGVAPNGERILSGATVELMKMNHLDKAVLPDLNWSQLSGYGYGLGVRTMIDKPKGGSNGSVGEFGWGGAAGGTILVDTDYKMAYFYSHHMLNPHEEYYQPRLRNVVYSCITR